jgi:hypothetical protein
MRRSRNMHSGAEPPLEHFYNRIAGGALERLAALSDGVFAFAMTLLVLDIRVPQTGSVHSERELLQALAALVPRFVMYAMSFLTLGIFWVGQQTQLNQLTRADRDLAWSTSAFWQRSPSCRSRRCCSPNSSRTARRS